MFFDIPTCLRMSLTLIRTFCNRFSKQKRTVLAIDAGITGLNKFLRLNRSHRHVLDEWDDGKIQQRNNKVKLLSRHCIINASYIFALIYVASCIYITVFTAVLSSPSHRYSKFRFTLRVYYKYLSGLCALLSPHRASESRSCRL